MVYIEVCIRRSTVIYHLNNTISSIKTVIFYIKIVDSDIPSLTWYINIIIKREIGLLGLYTCLLSMIRVNH